MDPEYEELYKWIEEHTITRPKRNINRDFADAIPLVEILKKHYPKLVDLHNYSPKNSQAQKVSNWETLNNKVLKRLKLPLTKQRMEQLAKGEPGAIEKLLIELKKSVDVKSAGEEIDSQVFYLEDSPKSGKVSTNVTKKKVIPVAVFDKMKSDLTEKDEAVDILKKKVDHLESLLSLKEERIRDLNQQLQTIVNTTASAHSTRADLQGTKFFNLF